MSKKDHSNTNFDRINISQSNRSDEHTHVTSSRAEKVTGKQYDTQASYRKRDDRDKKPFSKSERHNPESTHKASESIKKRPRISQGDEQKSRLPKPQTDVIRLNKYLADAGVCSRREADQLIASGAVTVNGKVVTQLGTKVTIYDKVVYGGKLLKRERLRYVLLNKPKDYITTADDPFDRKTVMDLVKDACSERIYPVGRLDRNSLGLLLLTNDGELAKKLTHPRYKVNKLYHVFLDKPLTKNDMLRMVEGLELEDGKATVDAIAYVKDAVDKREVGVKLHSGKNRIVRRIFEHLGYQVVRLDRVEFAGLTKFKLPRGRWRHLTEAEISMLKRLR